MGTNVRYEQKKLEEVKAEEENLKKTKIKYDSNQILILIQMIVCTIIIISMLVFKNTGLDFYQKIKEWYKEKLYDSIILPEEMDDIMSRGGRFVSKNVDNKGDKSKIDESPEDAEGYCQSFRFPCHSLFAIYQEDLPGIYAQKVINEFKCPVREGIITSKFGDRHDPITGAESIHSGLDIGAGANSKIYAVMPGKVEKAEKNPYYGNYILLDHGNEFKTLYAHCNKLLVGVGDIIEPSGVIALIGRTGRATGYHLHLEFIINGEKCDPEPFIRL